MGLERQITLIRDGDPVSAAIANRAPRSLLRNELYLYDLIQSAALGQTLWHRQAAVSSSCSVGTPVYWEATASRYSPAAAAYDARVGAGPYDLAESSFCRGVVARKHTPTLADIVLRGLVELDFSAAADATAVGRYNLDTVAGRLTTRRPTVLVPVLTAYGNGLVLVDPGPIPGAGAYAHEHKVYAIVCRPAGATTPPSGDGPHTVEEPDADQPGWLPADHASFAGKTVPSGAKFGYNLALDAELRGAWPVRSPFLEWDRGFSRLLGAVGVPREFYAVNDDGLWWLTDCYGDAPWPPELDTAFGASDSGSNSGSSASADPAICPTTPAMQMRLWQTRPTASSEGFAVRTLASLDSRISVRCRNGQEGNAGDLVLDLELLRGLREDVRGYLALKEPTADGFDRGPVCEGVYALSTNVSLSAPATARLDSEDSSSPTLHFGPVGIAVAPPTSLQVDVELVRLDGAEQEFADGVPYVGLPAGRASSIRGKIPVPFDTPFASPRLTLRLLILGDAAGTLPALAVTARRVLRPASGASTLPGSGAEFAVAISTALAVGTNGYREVVGTPFAVAAGDLVLYEVSRAASDGYAGGVGLLHQSGVLTGA